nr:DnaJ domain-containing protein [Candidatus Gracilibacteria bacterium]
MNKNYYDILGVTKTSSEDDIKKAYRKLAMKYHPDRNKGDKAAESKFKEINEAYGVLGDNEKRKQYDTFGSGFSGFNSQGGGNPFTGAGSYSYTNGTDFSGFEDLFSSFAKGGSRRTKARSFDFSDLFGGGFSNVMGGEDDFTSNYRNNKEEKEENLDVEKTYEVPVFDLILGCSIEVEGMNRKKVKLKIPANTKPGTKFRVKDLGKSIGGKVGNLIVKIDAKMPKHISDVDKSLLERIRENVGY